MISPQWKTGEGIGARKEFKNLFAVILSFCLPKMMYFKLFNVEVWLNALLHPINECFIIHACLAVYMWKKKEKSLVSVASRWEFWVWINPNLFARFRQWRLFNSTHDCPFKGISCDQFRESTTIIFSFFKRESEWWCYLSIVSTSPYIVSVVSLCLSFQSRVFSAAENPLFWQSATWKWKNQWLIGTSYLGRTLTAAHVILFHACHCG